MCTSIVELAKRAPKDRKALGSIRGIGPDVVRRRVDDVLAAIARGREAEPIKLEAGERLGTEPGDGPVIALAESLVRARAQEAGLAYELIASRSELEAIVGAARRGDPAPDVRTLTGWRKELVGADLRDLLAGRSAVGVGPQRRLVLSERPA